MDKRGIVVVKMVIYKMPGANVLDYAMTKSLRN